MNRSLELWKEIADSSEEVSASSRSSSSSRGKSLSLWRKRCRFHVLSTLRVSEKAISLNSPFFYSISDLKSVPNF